MDYKELNYYKVADLLISISAPAISSNVLDPMAGNGDMLAAAVRAGVDASCIYDVVERFLSPQVKRLYPGSPTNTWLPQTARAARLPPLLSFRQVLVPGRQEVFRTLYEWQNHPPAKRRDARD